MGRSCNRFPASVLLVAVTVFLIWRQSPESWRKALPSNQLDQLVPISAPRFFGVSKTDNDQKDTLTDARPIDSPSGSVPMPVAQDGGPRVMPDKIGDLADTSKQFVRQFCKYKLFKLKTQPRICLYHPQEDIFVSKDIIAYGMWESSIVATVLYHLQELQRKFGQKEVVFMDLGANVGTFTLTTLSYGVPTIAVDPLDSAVTRLTSSIQLNGFTPLATFYKKAISDRPGCGQMKVNVRNKGGSEVNQMSCDESSKSDVVQTVTLDEIALNLPQEKPLNIVMKMDIQRYEPYAILGGKNLFRRQNVRLIFMEWEEMGNAFRDNSRYDDQYRALIEKSFDFLLNEMKYEVYSNPGGTKLAWEDKAHWSQDIILAQAGFWWGRHESL